MRIVSAPRKGLCQLKLFDNCILDALEDNYSEIAQNTFAANSFNLLGQRNTNGARKRTECKESQRLFKLHESLQLLKINRENMAEIIQ